MDIHVQHLKGFDLSIVVTGSTLTKQYSSTEMVSVGAFMYNSIGVFMCHGICMALNCTAKKTIIE